MLDYNLIYPSKGGLEKLLKISQPHTHNGHEVMRLQVENWPKKKEYIKYLRKLINDCKIFGYSNPKIVSQLRWTHPLDPREKDWPYLLKVDEELNNDGWPRFWNALHVSPIFAGCAGHDNGQIKTFSEVYPGGIFYQHRYSSIATHYIVEYNQLVRKLQGDPNGKTK